jgi:hypothetical protein
MAQQLEQTEEWKQYQSGVDYNNKINYYGKTELNWNFYNGKQWLGIVTNGLARWTFNICRASINYFVASIMSQKIKMQYSAENIPDESEDPKEQDTKKFVDMMSNYADMKWEKDKMDSKLRQLLLDGANGGDMCAYVYWDANKETGQAEKGDFTTEVIDGVNVLFGNPNDRNVESQPYIIIVGREMTDNLKAEAKENGIDKTLIESITADLETQYQAGWYGKIELDNRNETGKCLYIIKFWKKDGQVYWNKSTRYCPIRKDVELGIKRYPIAWTNWDKIKNSYHGMPVIEGIIDNQISINQLFAMVSYWIKFQAFGKVLYDGTKLAGWSNKIGEALKVQGPVGNDVVVQLQGGNFNGAVLTIIDLAIKYTKDFIGASDAALGLINPRNTSAIIAISKQAAIPLENIQANLYQFVEDLGLIWGEFMLKKYNNRKISYRENCKVTVGEYNKQNYEDILLACKVDVGPSTYWSEITSMQTLDALLKTQKIGLIQYLERIPNGVIPKKQELIEEIKATQNEVSAREQEYEIIAKIIEQYVPAEAQSAVLQMLQGSQGNVGDGNALPM